MRGSDRELMTGVVSFNIIWFQVMCMSLLWWMFYGLSVLATWLEYLDTQEQTQELSYCLTSQVHHTRFRAIDVWQTKITVRYLTHAFTCCESTLLFLFISCVVNVI